MIMVRVEAMAGDRIQDTIGEMIDLREKTGFAVVCRFNGIDINALPNMNREEILKSYHESVEFEREAKKEKQREEHGHANWA